MKKNVDHDSRDSKRGDFYQSLVAVLYAISKPELKKFETLVIEHKGDVSFDNLIQLETKHHKSGHSLSDTSEEFWKTLYNWLKQSDTFQSLILHTTSHFPIKGLSELKKWNISSLDDRIQILNKIKFDYKMEGISQYQISKITIEILRNLNISENTIDILLKLTKKKYSQVDFNKLLIDSNLSEVEINVILHECKDTSQNKYKIWNYSRFVESYSKEKLRNIISTVTIDTNQKNDINTIIEISESPVFLGVCKSKNDCY